MLFLKRETCVTQQLPAPTSSSLPSRAAQADVPKKTQGHRHTASSKSSTIKSTPLKRPTLNIISKYTATLVHRRPPWVP
jgi:hypothetical protein